MGADVEDRLAAMESRLARIEQRLQLSQPSSPPPAAMRPAVSTPAPVRPPQPVEEARPGNWLGIIAVICFVLAAGFIVKLSIDSGWLTPARQVGLAALLGLTLIGAGIALLESDRAYAGLLPGAGVIVLYLTAFAAHRYYALITFEEAIALTSAVSAICIWLYTQIRHDAYAITAAAGAYVAPAVLGLNADAVFSLYYFLICSVAFATISIWVRSRTLTLVSAYLALLMSGLLGMDVGQDALLAGLLIMHFIVFAAGTYLYTMQNRLPLTGDQAWSFLPALLLFYAMEYYLIDRLQPGLAPWVSLGFAAFLIGLYLSARRYFPDGLGSQSLILAFATVVAFHSIYLELLPEDFRPWLFVAIMLGAAFLPVDVPPQRRGGFWIPALALLAILVIEYVTIMSHLLYDDAWIPVALASFASLWLALAYSRNGLVRRTHGHTLLGAAHLLAVLGLWRLTHADGSLAVSASWLFYGVAVIFFAFALRDEVMAKSALFVLAFAAGKALLYDAASAPTVVRIVCLLLTGAVLYGCGLFMRRIGSWRS